MPMIIVTSKISKVNIRAMFCYFVLYSNLVWDLYSLTIIENRAMSVFLGSLVNVAHRPWSVIPQPLYRNSSVLQIVLGAGFELISASKPDIKSFIVARGIILPKETPRC
jgi:hypothetical protein